MKYKSLKDVYAEKSLGITLPPLRRQLAYQNILLNEGGAGGSMIHPFDVPGVRTGADLINIFDEAVKSIQSERPAVKIDGANVSIKIARDIEGNIYHNTEGEMEFGIERGTKKEDDIKGVTLDRLGARFVNKADPSKPHGLIEAGSIILNIFNTALPSIEADLQKLKFFGKEDQRFFNMEYVYGHTNVIGYDKNFLAIHGINEINIATRKSKEVGYNKNVLEDIIRKIRPIAKKYGFDVYSTIPAEFDEDVTDVDFSPALNTNLTVRYTQEHAVTKTIAAWLKECNNPTGKTVVLADNKRISTMGLQNYGIVMQGVPLDTAIKDGNEVQIHDAICGAVFLHATLLMGQILKNALRSDIGHVGLHEGIVVRNLTFKGKPVGVPVKFTGEFIVGKEAGKFAKSQDEENSNQQMVNNLNRGYMAEPRMPWSGPGEGNPSGTTGVNV